uniref:Uncharacterized protein n=1 Tax=viral metagenome TaxID=1070528 RepID=A0A6M3LF91_9ZZZZ
MATGIGTDSGCVKEQTIRSLISECQKGQASIRALLEENFARHSQTEGKCEGKPPRDNVLDEILDSLQELILAQRSTIDFIMAEIIPKL